MIDTLGVKSLELDLNADVTTFILQNKTAMLILKRFFDGWFQDNEKQKAVNINQL